MKYPNWSDCIFCRGFPTLFIQGCTLKYCHRLQCLFGILIDGFQKEFGLSTNDDDDDKKNDIDGKQIEHWYKERIYGIEESTGNVENSLILCNYAVSHKGIKSLSSLLETLLLFHKVLYEWSIDDKQISIKQFEAMDIESRLLFVLKESVYDFIISDIENRSQYFVSERGLPSILLNICPKLLKGLSNQNGATK